MNAVCPACGVAVVPGYVRCPRCHAALPLGAGRTRRTAADPGGTAVARRGFPISAVVVAVAGAAAILLVFGMRGSSKPAAAVPVALPGPVEAIPDGSAARIAVAPLAAPPPQPAATPAATDRRAAAAQLEDTLHRRRLWGRAQITGDRIDVRSGSCGDSTMRPVIDGARVVLRGAGLTRLRCLEQSGAVIFERDL